jgi:hypothetical protein
MRNLIKKKSISFYLNDSFMKKNWNKYHSYVVEQRKTLFDCRSWWFFRMSKNTRFIWSESLTNDKFFWKDVICKHDCFEKLIVNDEFENKEILDEFMQRYRIKKMITSNYHFQINEMIKKVINFYLTLCLKCLMKS